MNFARQWDRIENDLGYNDCDMRRDRPFVGQPHTDCGTRGATRIEGVTFRDLRDAFIRAACLASHHLNPALYDEADKGEHAALCENDLYSLDWSKIDPGAVSRNLSCEIERLMGIFPNVPPLRES